MLGLVPAPQKPLELLLIIYRKIRLHVVCLTLSLREIKSSSSNVSGAFIVIGYSELSLFLPRTVKQGCLADNFIFSGLLSSENRFDWLSDFAENSQVRLVIRQMLLVSHFQMFLTIYELFYFNIEF